MAVGRALQHVAQAHRWGKAPVDDRRVPKLVVVDGELLGNVDVNILDAELLEAPRPRFDQICPFAHGAVTQKRAIAIVERADGIRAADEEEPAVAALVHEALVECGRLWHTNHAASASCDGRRLSKKDLARLVRDRLLLNPRL